MLVGVELLFIMPCSDCAGVRVEMLSMKEFMAQWFTVLLQKMEAFEEQNQKLADKMSRQYESQSKVLEAQDVVTEIVPDSDVKQMVDTETTREMSQTAYHAVTNETSVCSSSAQPVRSGIRSVFQTPARIYIYVTQKEPKNLLVEFDANFV